MTDPKWREMLITRVSLLMDEMARELAYAPLMVPEWEMANMATYLLHEYAGKIVDAITEQLSEGSRPVGPDPRTVESLREYLSKPRRRPDDSND